MTASSTQTRESVQLWYTYCHLVHAGVVADELGFVEDDLAKLGARLAYFRSVPENDFYPHFLHNLDGLFRFGGCIPPVHVKADLRDTVLLGLQWLAERGGMLVRAGDGAQRLTDLRGRRIGLSRSLNRRKVDYRRVTEERGIELMLELNGMSRDDVEIVDCPFADDWYDGPEMAAPLARPSELWRLLHVQPDLRHRPLEPALLAGAIDACFVTDPLATEYAASNEFRLVESLARRPDWTLQIGGAPYALTCTRKLADEHPDLVTAYIKGVVRAGRWCNADRRAAAAVLERTGFYPPADVLYEAVGHVDFVPNLSVANLTAVEIEMTFMLSHGYIRSAFDVRDWAAPQFLLAAERELAEEARPGRPV